MQQIKKLSIVIIITLVILLSSKGTNNSDYYAENGATYTDAICTNYILMHLRQLEQEKLQNEQEDEQEQYVLESKLDGFIVTIPETYDIVLSDIDIQYIYQCVETETYGADMISKTHIISVILNRCNNEKFPSTPIEVITSPNQFAYFRVDISQETIDALEYVLLQGDTTDGALFFHSGNLSNTFAGHYYIFTDDIGHHFYK